MSKFKMTQIKGVIPAMMTFFDKEENVDIQCTRRMVDFMLDHGADGFYLTGSTGECFTMTAEERNLVVDTVIDQVKGRVPVIVHVGDIGTKKSIELAKHAYEAGADAISLINTLTGMAVDFRARRPILANVTGGLSGPAVKPVALRMVYQVAQAVNVPVIGMGGIDSGLDALEFMLCGASAVQVGMANLYDPYACVRIAEEMEQILAEEGLSSVQEIIGQLRV